MLSSKIYEEVITKANLNTQSITFEGNFLFGFYDDTFLIEKQDSNNAYNVSQVSFVPVSEIISTEQPFLEDNNRSDFTKIYEFAFPSNTPNVIEALQELRDYYYANPTFTVLDNGVTYRVNAKVTRPNKSREIYDRGGYFIMIYQMQFFLTVYDDAKGYDTNQSQILIDSQLIPYTSFSFGTQTTMDTSNKFGVNNVEKVPYARGVAGNGQIVYDKSTLSKKMLDSVLQINARDTEYTLSFNIDSKNYTSTIYISSGGITVQKNGVILIDFEWVEK